MIKFKFKVLIYSQLSVFIVYRDFFCLMIFVLRFVYVKLVCLCILDMLFLLYVVFCVFEIEILQRKF